MIARRTFLKGIGALPFLFGGKEVQERKTCDDTTKPEVDSSLPVIYAHWCGRWWKAQGNKIEWTDLRNRPLYPATDDDFVNWNILDITYDYCEALIPCKDVLLWVGRRGLWEIYYDYCFGLKEFMFQFRYIGNANNCLLDSSFPHCYRHL